MKTTIRRLLYVTALVAAFAAGQVSQRPQKPPAKIVTLPPDPIYGQVIDENIDARPDSFFEDLESLMADYDFATASGLLLSADVNELVQAYPGKFLAIQRPFDRRLELPGTVDKFEESQVIVLPGLYAGESPIWLDYCEIFANKFNRIVDKKEKLTEQRQVE